MDNPFQVGFLVGAVIIILLMALGAIVAFGYAIMYFAAYLGMLYGPAYQFIILILSVGSVVFGIDYGIRKLIESVKNTNENP